MRLKKLTALLLCLSMIFTLTACSKTQVNLFGIKQRVKNINPREVTLDVFVPEEALMPMVNAVDKYKYVKTGVSIRLTLDDGVMLAEKVLSGYSCDVLIDFSMIMDQVDASRGEDVNPSGYDCIYSDTRRDIFEGPADSELAEQTGAETLVYSAALTRACKYSDEAKEFVEFLMSEEARKIYTECDFTVIE